MKKIELFVLFLIVISCKTEIYNNNKQSSRNGVKGKVKKITEILLKPIRNNNNEYDTIKISNFYYKSNGQLKNKDLFVKFGDNSFNYKTKYKYNSKGQIIKTIGNEINNNNETIREFNYKDDKLNEIKEFSKNKNSTEKYYYENNLLKKSIRKEFNTDIKSFDTILTTSLYDKNELFIESEEKLQNKLRFKRIFERNKDGLITKMITIDSNGADTLFYDYKFDSKGSYILKIGKFRDTIRIINKRIINYK